jgi:Clp amino terminal domain, pathogenicity island component
MTLDELIVQTRSCALSLEPLTLLASAARQQQELADLGEKLLDHFVQEARTAGCSWSQIGTALGVTKQAAQQRHSTVRSLISKLKEGVASSLEGMVARFTVGARRAVVLAQEEARNLRHDHIGTEHLLLGVLAEGEGIGAQALVDADLTLDAVRVEVERIVGRGTRARKGHIPFTPRAKKVLELALRQALKLGHNHIGTEHILLGLLHEGQGAGVQAAVAAGAQLEQLRESVEALSKRTEPAAE